MTTNDLCLPCLASVIAGRVGAAAGAAEVADDVSVAGVVVVVEEVASDLVRGRSMGTSLTSASKVSISMSESELDIDPMSESEESALHKVSCGNKNEGREPEGIQ